MNKNYYVFVFIPTDNCVDKISLTIESVLKQTFNHNRLRIVAVDNCSNDGTYEKLLQYAQKNNKMMAVYRLPEKTKPARIWKKTAEIVEYISKIDYSTILLPGNILYPEYIERCTNLFHTMKNFEGDILISEADLIDKNGNKYYQEDIYTDSCIIKGEVDSQFLTTGIGHRIQPFYREFSISANTPLFLAAQLSDYNDWTRIFYSRKKEFIYINEKLACLQDKHYENPITDLMNRYELLKSLFYQQEQNDIIYEEQDFVQKEDRELSYENLSILALKYAITQIKEEKFDIANKCLLLSEIVYEDINKNPIYNDIENVINTKKNIECLVKYKKLYKSKKPPKYYYIF